MRETLFKLLENIKGSSAAIGGIILSFLTPIIPLILIVGGAIVLDTLTGVYKSKKKDIPITSKGYRSIVSKMVMYNAAVILFFCIETYILQDIIGLLTDINLILTKVVTTTLLFIEVKRINENYEEVTGVDAFKEFKKLLKRSKDAISEVKSISK